MKKYNAPYFPIVWLDDFLKLVKRVRVAIIDRKWIGANNICSETNASKVVSGLKFLKLIDDEGKVIESNMNPLKLEGEPYKKALQKVVKEAYADLLGKVDITKVYPNDVLNYFISTHQYSKPQAQAALSLFLHIATQAGLQVSDELSKRKSSSESREEDKSKKTSSRRIRKPRSTEIPSPEKEFMPSLKDIDGKKIIVSVRGKGINHQQEINSVVEIKIALEIISKLIELNLQKEKKEE